MCIIILIALLLLVFWMESKVAHNDPAANPGEVQNTVATNPEEEQVVHNPAAPENTNPSGQLSVEALQDAKSGVMITDLLSYTGAFMEDRTDDIVTDVLAIQVTNTGEEYIQTMDITLTAGDTQAQFSLSTLFPGETVIVLEKNRMAYSTAPAFEQAQFSAVALFDAHPGMCQDKLDIQCLDGVINVTNISKEDITGDILIYYKNYVSGVYYGGITYRLRIEGGLKAGEIRQGSAGHFKPDNSAVVFVTCG